MKQPKQMSNLFYTGLLYLLLTQPLAIGAVNSELETAPPPQIAAAPSRVTVDISKGRAGGSIRVFNLGDESVSINTSVQNWTLDATNNIEVIPPTPHSLDQSLIINPINFTIEPGQQQVVRFAIRPRSAPGNGEQRAMVFFNQISDGPDDGTIDIKFRMGVAIYGVSGDVQRVGTIHDLAIEHINNTASLSVDIESTGNANIRLDGQISVWAHSAVLTSQTALVYQ